MAKSIRNQFVIKVEKDGKSGYLMLPPDKSQHYIIKYGEAVEQSMRFPNKTKAQFFIYKHDFKSKGFKATPEKLINADGVKALPKGKKIYGVKVNNKAGKRIGYIHHNPIHKDYRQKPQLEGACFWETEAKANQFINRIINDLVEGITLEAFCFDDEEK